MRIAPVEPPYPAPIADLLTRMTPPGAPGILQLFRVLAVNPTLAERARGWGGYLLGGHATLPLRDRELVIDRVCARCGAEYEWGVHVAAFAGAAGFTPQEIAIVADPQSDGGGLAPRDRLLLRLVDTLHDSAQVPDALWDELAAVWEPPQLVELLMLAGWYHAISYVCNAAKVPLEAWQARFSSHRAG
ncbi:MAG TPA: carboxymuconolactone decarboxylase family protein [Albitalea sp.]|uniref:carboxymuconolactone decarboxylase family protein n=1 Tax=Piscinibacter sp. TaxID=1903157 RepID=UPI002ED6A3CD